MASEIELTKDLEELKGIRSSATRPTVQKLLDSEISRVNQEIEKIASLKNNTTEPPKTTVPTGASSSRKNPTKKLTTFAYDESDKFVKLYYTLPGVQTLPKESINSSFTDNSFNVYIENLNGINYEFEARGFTDYIDAEKSTVKQKTDSVLLMLKKLKEGVTWEKLLALEKKPSADVPKFDQNADPQEGLMSMMRKMYEEGDDETKRMIKKSMYESNQKKGMGGGEFGM
jgi:calcyclin binding protein